MRRLFSRSLKHKLSLMVILSTMVPLLCLGFFSYRIATDISEEKAKMSGLNTLRQLRTQLELMTKDVENMSIFLIGDDTIQSYLTTRSRVSLNQSSIYGFLMNLAYSKDYIANIDLRPLNGNPSIAQTSILQSGFASEWSRDPTADKLQPKQWSSLYEDVTISGRQRVISLVRPILGISTYRPIGEMTVSLNEDVIARLLGESDLEGNGYVLLTDRDGTVISSRDADRLYRPVGELLPDYAAAEAEEGSFTNGSGRTMSTVLYEKIPSMGWTLVGVIPYREYSAQNRYVLALTGIAVLVAGSLTAAFVLLLISKVTNPLLTLVKSLNAANPEKPMPLLPVPAVDEVGQLVRSYNRFSDRIDKLTEQVKRSESLKKEADLLALQAQINPHFLYNTLSSVNWLALMNKDYKISEMVSSLSEFLRFSLNGGGEYCTVRQEIEHAQYYVNIQSIRYPNRFDFQIRSEPELMDRPMLKLLLQPLIENAILHGILKKPGKGSIVVQVERRESGIGFAVSDDGAGIEADRLAELRALLSETGQERQVVLKQSSYGLRNVHQRLMLHYGGDCGLELQSRPTQGTRISFVIPDPDTKEATDR